MSHSGTSPAQPRPQLAITLPPPPPQSPLTSPIGPGPLELGMDEMSLTSDGSEVGLRSTAQRADSRLTASDLHPHVRAPCLMIRVKRWRQLGVCFWGRASLTKCHLATVAPDVTLMSGSSALTECGPLCITR